MEKSHHDLPHPGNENGNQDEECDTRKQEGQCNDSLKEHKVSVELDDETLPQSMKEVLEQHKLVFYDLNTVCCLPYCIKFVWILIILTLLF